jgi:hypothetical protein
MKKILIALFMLSLCHTAPLQASNLFIQGGLHFGGDTLATANFVGGGSDSIEAGGLISGSVGLITSVGESMELRSSIGIKMDGIFAENGELVFTRLPLELMAFSTGEAVRFGAGLSYHLAPELEIDQPSMSSATVEFDDAAGFVIQLEYQLSERGHIGLKATLIDYEISGSGGAEVDGDSLGIILGARF